MKRILIIIALLWATAAGAECWNFEGHEICDHGPPYHGWEISRRVEPKVEWGYKIIGPHLLRGYTTIPEDIEIGLREDGVVVWRKVKEDGK